MLFQIGLALAWLAAQLPPGKSAAGELGIIGAEAPDLAILTHGDTPGKISDFRNKWVFLQLGTTWLPNSEAMTLVGSNLRESLEGRPFEFVQIFDEPAITDAELYRFTQFAGVAAVMDSSRHRNFFRGRRLPTWCLIDPDGVVRAAGGVMSPERIRKALRKAWGGDPQMAGAPIEATPGQRKGEEMLELYDGRDLSPVAQAAENILREDPTNELALRFLLHAELWTKGFARATQDFAARTKGMQLSDGTRLYEFLCRLGASDDSSTRDELETWAKKYPGSRFLKCTNLLYQKLPDQLTPEEKNLLKIAWRQPKAGSVKTFLGLVHQWAGNAASAEQLIRANARRGTVGQLALAHHLNRLGRSAEARKLLGISDGVAAEPSDRTVAWERMLAHTVLLDWPGASHASQHYQKLRPEKVQGVLIGWLAASISGDKNLAHKRREEALAIIEAQPRYSAANTLLKEHREPSVRDLTDIQDLHVRFDTALLFVLLDLDDKGKPARALQRAQRAFSVGAWPYDIFNTLRSLDLLRAGALGECSGNLLADPRDRMGPTG